MKELIDNCDADSKRLFFKEARLLNSLKHQNIVEFKSYVNAPNSHKCAFLMEYVCFDLEPFDCHAKVSSLKELLVTLDSQSDFKGFEHLQVKTWNYRVMLII